MSGIEVLSVTSELFPLVKTGGLADVAGALPHALKAEDVAVTTLLPGYPAVIDALEEAESVHDYPELMGGPARLLKGRAAGLDLLVIDAPHLYERPGNPYLSPDGQDWPDNAFRFAALARVAADLGEGLLPALRPDLIHAHDWQAALVPAYLHYDGHVVPPVVVTIHNLAFQGRFPAYLLGPLGLPATAYDINGLEYFGGIGFLKGGLYFADHVTTVSPSYAREITTVEGGMGLDGLLRARGNSLSGITNGIDLSVWDPMRDPHISSHFDLARLKRRRGNREELATRFGLDPGGRPIFAVVSRLTGQKGLDLLLAAIPHLLRQGGDLVVLGSGDPDLEAGFRTAASAAVGRIGCMIGYDEHLAHLVQAGADMLLVPSRFEPCGLTQLCALRYGSVPVAARVGGLADTIIDANEAAIQQGVATGLLFEPDSVPALQDAINCALHLWEHPKVWRRLQSNGMRQDVSWGLPAHRYAKLYRSLLTGITSDPSENVSASRRHVINPEA